MKKSIVILTICLLVIVATGVILFFVNNNSENSKQENSNSSNNNGMVSKNNNINEDKINNEVNNQMSNENSNDTTKTGKTLVVYFSAIGNTEKIAKYINNETKGDILEIVPKGKYTSEDLAYNNDDCRANREQQDQKARPEIANNIDVTEYDTIFLGYPIWWGDVPKIILTFLDKCNLNGKTVIPFCTSGSTGISQSQITLKSYNKNMKLIEGKRFSSQASQDEISSWVKWLEY